MSQLFKLRRFYLLLGKHWFENRKAYLLFLVTIAAFFTGWFAFTLMIGNPYSFGPYNQSMLYFGGLFIAGCLSASLAFRDFATKPKKINYLVLPAAIAEKLLCVLFYGVLIFFVAYTLIFYVTDYLALKVANNANAAMLAGHSEKAVEWKQRFGLTGDLRPSKLINVFSPAADTYIFYPGDNVDLFSAFFPIQSAFILGSAYFAKNNLFKTMVALLLLWLLFFVVEMKIFFPLLPENVSVSSVLTNATVIDNKGNETHYTLPFWIGSVATFLMRFGITPVLWIAIYYRMKEKEI